MIRTLALVLALLLPHAALAQSLPDPQSTTVNDYAGLLTEPDTVTLVKALGALNAETGVEGTVVTVTDRAQYGDSGSLESFVTQLFNKWGVGDRTRNDGFMVFVSRGDREARIELGSGYPAAANRQAKAIMDRVMVPALNQQNYSSGLREGTLAVIEQIALPHAKGEAISTPSNRGYSGLALFLIAAAGLFGLQRWTKQRRNRCKQCGHLGLETTQEPLREDLPDGGWRTAQQNVTRRCPNCGWQESHVARLPVITYYDSRGNTQRVQKLRNERNSSGFGGGSSSGGGASGRW